MNRLVRLLLTFLFVMSLVGVFAPGLSAQETGSREDEDETPAASSSSGEEGVYVSPSYGYAVSYDDSWTLNSEESQGGYDLLYLESEPSAFYLEGYSEYDGEAETCVESQIDSFSGQPSVEDFDILDDEDGEPIEVYDEDVSYALFQVTVTNDAGDTGDLVIWVECRPLQTGESVLIITQVIRDNDYESELERKDAIIDTLDLEGVEEVDQASTSDEPIEDEVAHTLELLETVEPDVDAYWFQVFEQNGMGEYEAPTYVNFTESIETACGAAEPFEVGPFYCFLDNTVYMDVLFMAEYYIPYGDFVVFRSVAHEVGHHVQNLMDIQSCGGVTSCLAGYTTLDVELMADCFAGAWAQNADDRGIIAPGDVENAIVALAAFLGDPASVDMTDPNAHGPGSLRTWWFLRGFYEGPSACVGDGVPAS